MGRSMRGALAFCLFAAARRRRVRPGCAVAGSAAAAAGPGASDRRGAVRLGRRCATVQTLSHPPPHARLGGLSTPPPRRSATGSPTMASTRSRSSRCPPTARSSTGRSARGPAWNAQFRRTLGAEPGASAGSMRRASPPGPTSRSASPRTASAAGPRRSWSTSAPGRRRRIMKARRCAAGSSSTSSQPEAVAGPRGRPARRRRASSPGRRTSAPPGGATTRAWSAGAISRRSPTIRPSPSWSRRPGARPGRSGCGAARRAPARRGRGRAQRRRLSDPDRRHPGRRPRRGDRLLLPSRPSQSPGANDNASGCAGDPRDRARTLNRLIASGALPRPRADDPVHLARRDRGDDRLLNARPEFARRTLATIHLDMIGGNTEITKSVLRVTRLAAQPAELRQRRRLHLRALRQRPVAPFADTGEAALPLIDPRAAGARSRREIGGFERGQRPPGLGGRQLADPVIYIADWPDRYIHTQRDVPGNLDPTKLRRAIFIARGLGLDSREPRRGADIPASGGRDARTAARPGRAGLMRRAQRLRRRRPRARWTSPASCASCRLAEAQAALARPLRAGPVAGGRRSDALTCALFNARAGAAVALGTRLPPRPPRGADGRLRL